MLVWTDYLETWLVGYSWHSIGFVLVIGEASSLNVEAASTFSVVCVLPVHTSERRSALVGLRHTSLQNDQNGCIARGVHGMFLWLMLSWFGRRADPNISGTRCLAEAGRGLLDYREGQAGEAAQGWKRPWVRDPNNYPPNVSEDCGLPWKQACT